MRSVLKKFRGRAIIIKNKIMQDRKKADIFAKVVIALALFFVGFYFGVIYKADSPLPDRTLDTQIEETITLSIDFGEEDGRIFSDIEFESGDSLFDVLSMLLAESEIELDYQDYGPDMGVFINSIDGIGGDDSGRWWQYRVNGEYGQVGVSQYVVQSEDFIEFKFTNERE